MRLMQPTVTPLPSDLSLEGKVVIITGATAGLGLETARQALILRAATVVLACRNTSKGETTKSQLLTDPSVRKHNPDGVVKVMKVDMDDYASVQAFAASVRADLPRIDLLLLNAGLGFLPNFETAPSGHERTLQINFLSNVLLLAELLPHLQASAAAHSYVARISWVGSRTFISGSTLSGKNPAKEDETILERLDDKERYASLKQYADTKLLCVMWFYELARRLDRSEKDLGGSNRIVINMMCPGMVDTNISDNLSLPLRAVATVLKLMRARSVEQGGWLLLHSAAVLGPESHGKFIGDKDVLEPIPFITSPAGKKLTERIWVDTAAEMSKLTTIPPEMAA